MNVTQALREILYRHLTLENTAVFLFGSRARNTASERADYDVGVWSDRPIRLSTLSRIEGEIELQMIPASVDIVDFARLPEKFRDLALQNIEIWNKPQKSPDSNRI